MSEEEVMRITDLPEFDQIMLKNKLDERSYFAYLPDLLNHRVATVDEWIDFLVNMNATLSKVVESTKGLISAFVQLNCGDYPSTVRKVTRNNASVDMNMLSVCHPDILISLAEKGKVSVSAKNLAGLGADECITYSESVYYSPARD